MRTLRNDPCRSNWARNAATVGRHTAIDGLSSTISTRESQRAATNRYCGSHWPVSAAYSAERSSSGSVSVTDVIRRLNGRSAWPSLYVPGSAGTDPVTASRSTRPSMRETVSRQAGNGGCRATAAAGDAADGRPAGGSSPRAGSMVASTVDGGTADGPVTAASHSASATSRQCGIARPDGRGPGGRGAGTTQRSNDSECHTAVTRFCHASRSSAYAPDAVRNVAFKSWSRASASPAGRFRKSVMRSR